MIFGFGQDKKYFAVEDFEESLLQKFINDYANDTIGNELELRLTYGDLKRQLGSHKNFYSIDIVERLELDEPNHSKYENEFAENGLGNIQVKFNSKSDHSAQQDTAN